MYIIEILFYKCLIIYYSSQNAMGFIITTYYSDQLSHDYVTSHIPLNVSSLRNVGYIFLSHLIYEIQINVNQKRLRVSQKCGYYGLLTDWLENRDYLMRNYVLSWKQYHIHSLSRDKLGFLNINIKHYLFCPPGALLW